VSGWNADNAARVAATASITIVDGSSFSVSATNGDILPGTHHGAYFRDTRFVSEWLLTVNGSPMEALTAVTPEPYQAKFIGRAARDSQGGGDTPLVVERVRFVGTGLREDVTIRNFSRADVECFVELQVGADFADLLEVKGGAILHHWSGIRGTTPTGLRIESVWKDHQRNLEILAPDALVTERTLLYQFTVPARGSWDTTIIATPKIDNTTMQAGLHRQVPVPLNSTGRRLREWGQTVPVPVASGPALTRTLERSQLDLESLKISDPATPGRELVAAGAPWFMALFGRDSLLTAYMALSVDPALALGTLQTLADYQGVEENQTTEEQPGRILHETRFGVNEGMSLGGGDVYYGSADATPLFVTLLGELRRWGQDPASIHALIPAADRALNWIRHYGDEDGDSFVEYQRLNPESPMNQGWKDSADGINFADGTIAEAPIALCEVQGYTYSAYEARAYLAADAGDSDGAARWKSRAEAFKREFNERFWMPERSYYAMALDRDKSQVDSCGSNIGHCLWSGIIDEDKAPAVVQQLLSAEMFSGWGVRTLASSMGAYNPVSYHNGSVWPHDNAIIVAGLMRYGFDEEARIVATAILEAADRFDGRLPELFCGFDRTEYPEPIPYPTACSPQAWASAAPIQLVRSLARFDPDIPQKQLWLAPAFPSDFGNLSVTNLPLAGQRLTLDISADEVTVSGLPDGVRLVRSPSTKALSASERADARWSERA
jgi:glycogen debranching enzyme